jgi:general secretion pathway protein A
MYNQFYGFRENPFSLLPDPDFLYVSKEHGTGLNLLELAILNQSGFCVISGEIGAGKTTIIREVLNRLDDQVSVGLITNTHSSFNDLMRWILAAFELKAESDEGVYMHRQFFEFVTEQFSKGRHTLLIIDEAQNLSVAALEQLRMLSNINSGSELLLQVILVGQRELRENLKRPELEQFAQRISIDYFLAPLNEAETKAYIEHRIAHAGGINPLFDDSACARIYRHSGGIPRVINRLCDLGLVYGYAENVRTIGADLVEAVVSKQRFDNAGDRKSCKSTTVAGSEVPVKEPARVERTVPKQPAKQVMQKKPVHQDTAKQTNPLKKQPVKNISTGERTMNKTEKAPAPAESDIGQSAENRDISAEAAVKRREQLERIAAEKAERAMAAVETAAANLAASRQAESEKHAAEKRLEEAISVGKNTSQLAVAAKTAAELTVAEREAAEADVLEKKKIAGLAYDKAQIEKATAEKRVGQLAAIEEEARLAAEQAIATAEKALAERVAAEKAAAEATAAATELVQKAVEERIAVETETSRRLAEVEQAAALAAAEQNRASQKAVEKVNSEKAARAQAEACVRMAEEKEAARAEAALAAEEKINAARKAQVIADASRQDAERAVAEQMAAEKAAIASATLEKVAMASVAADEAAEALRLAEKADAAKQAALREAQAARAAAASAARRAADARAAAEEATAVENAETHGVVEASPVQARLHDEPAMKGLIISGTREIDSKAQARGWSNTGRTWAAMAITAVVAGAAWFVVQSDGSRDTAGTDSMADKSGEPRQLSGGVKVETAAMEITGKPRKPGK